MTVKGNTGSLIRDGYVFAGWNTSADGSGVSYLTDSTFYMPDDDYSLFAKWDVDTAVKFRLSYDGNGATSGSPSEDQIEYSTEYADLQLITLLPNSGSLARTGFTFSGWNTLSDSSGDNFLPGETTNINNDDITFYAEWSPLPTYSVSYMANGATNGTAGGAIPLRHRRFGFKCTVE